MSAPAFDVSSMPPSVRLGPGSGGRPRLTVDARMATAEIYLHGAHVTRWQPRHATQPVLWMSSHSMFEPAKPIRGGVPVCFPWFGPNREHPGAPAHGFARLADWALEAVTETGDGSVSVVLTLAGENLSPAWPFRFRATLRVSVGATLSMELDVENRDQAAFAFEAALHTYLTVADVSRVEVRGLEETAYIDKVGGVAQRRQGAEAIRFAGEKDRVYLATAAACTVDDPGLNRRIVVAKQGSLSTVVWNPWAAKAHAMPDFGDDEWPGMVCVETANVGDAAVQLTPGGRHRMLAIVSVDSH
jgi:glucose-6-phosphate 1-epimerase